MRGKRNEMQFWLNAGWFSIVAALQHTEGRERECDLDVCSERDGAQKSGLVLVDPYMGTVCVAVDHKLSLDRSRNYLVTW